MTIFQNSPLKIGRYRSQGFPVELEIEIFSSRPISFCAEGADFEILRTVYCRLKVYVGSKIAVFSHSTCCTLCFLSVREIETSLFAA